MAQECCGCGSGNVVQLQPAPMPETLTTRRTWRDVLGGWRVRWSIGRMDYAVAPGLYRIGQPDSRSPVLVTANYKLTVDTVRTSVPGLDVWLLVLDTKGVNVWCAAGKGTFGTRELVERIQAVNLASVVEHRDLVVPQLGATGVAAHEVTRATGFSVHYGPVRARDIPAYLAAGRKASEEMRRVKFGWRERVVLAPVELAAAFKLLLAVAAVLLVLEVLRYGRVTPHLALACVPFVAAYLTGGLLIPLLLPWLPFRAFSAKGAVAGAAVAGAIALWLPVSFAEKAAIALLIPAITTHMAMLFTGATTFTTLGGARLEVQRALPLIKTAAGAGAILRVAAAFI